MSPENPSEPADVLIVDDNSSLTESARQLLHTANVTAHVAGTAQSARRYLDGGRYSLVLIDLMLPDGNGVELLQEYEPVTEARFVLMTSHPRLTDAVRKGCPRRVPMLPKPFSVDDLMEQVRRAVPDRGATGRDHGPDPFDSWIGSSPAIARLKRQIRSVAALDTTVFLLGESGTGKELAAEAIHRLSGRNGPLLTVNCGAMPETLVANELFGHEKGSYTGASRAQAGLFERAQGGTVFLDEVTELPMEHQPHLLRVLDSRSVTRIGGSRNVPVDVRVVAASNRVDQPLVQDKVLREDLFYRLMVFPIVLPPLRERVGDVRTLVEHILHRWNREHGTGITCSDEVMESLMRYPWPGNVRELKHTVQRLAILSDSVITEPPRFLDGFAGTASASGVPVGTSIRELERRLILATLEHFQGDRGRTAATLGISAKTLYNRLKAYEQEQANGGDRFAS